MRPTLARHARHAAATALLGIGAGAAAAQPSPSRAPVTAGLAVIASPSPYTGVDKDALIPAPFVNLEKGRFYLRGLEGGYRLAESGTLSVSAVLRPRFQSYEAEDSDALTGMADRRRTAEAGLRARFRAGDFRAGLLGVTDILGRHEGRMVTADTGWRLGGRGFSLTPSAGLVWQSPRFVDYYYGVRTGEARSGRPAYTGEAALNPFLGASGRAQLGGPWGLFAHIRHTWLDSAITASPIVDTATDTTGILAVTFAFGD